MFCGASLDTPRRDGCSKPLLSMYPWHGDLHRNYYSSPGALENNLSSHSVKTGEEESRERPTASRAGVHACTWCSCSSFNTPHGKWDQGSPCFWLPLQNAVALEITTERGPAVGTGLLGCTTFIFATSTCHSRIFCCASHTAARRQGQRCPSRIMEPGANMHIKAWLTCVLREAVGGSMFVPLVLNPRPN